MFEEMRGEPGPPTVTCPAADYAEERVANAGLTSARDAALSGGDRLVAAREYMLEIEAVGKQADDEALREHHKRAAALIERFRRGHCVTLERALAGVDRLVAGATGRRGLDGALYGMLPELCAPEAMPDEQAERLMRMGSAEAAGATLRGRLVELAEAGALPLSPLSAEEVEARVERAAAQMREAKQARAAAYADVPAPSEKTGQAWRHLEADLPLSESELEEIEALLAVDEEAAHATVRAHRVAVAAAARAVKRVEAALAGREVRATA